MNIGTFLPTTGTKVNSLLVCLADLADRGVTEIVESIDLSRVNQLPIIRLCEKPAGFCGVPAVHLTRDEKYRARLKIKVMVTQHMNCQLRWEESAA